MGKKRKAATKSFEHPYPSRYGSHGSMISEWVRPLDSDRVICEDEKGLYVTDRNRLDTGVADPHRWSGKAHRDGLYESCEKVVDPKNKGESDAV